MNLTWKALQVFFCHRHYNIKPGGSHILRIDQIKDQHKLVLFNSILWFILVLFAAASSGSEVYYLGGHSLGEIDTSSGSFVESK